MSDPIKSTTPQFFSIEEVFRPPGQTQKRYQFRNLIGSSEIMCELFGLIKRVADSNSTLLIIGESGTGKEVVAKALHSDSLRRDEPFVPVNCGAIPEALLESELFGHEKGAFTGAISLRVGRFEMAHRGTIFLDEVGDMSPALQVKILRVLQEREFERVGGVRRIRVDVRVISASNRNLEDAVKGGRFREDLYYRLNVIPIYVPPLRARKEDIPLLIDHFMRKEEGKGRVVDGIAPKTMKILMEYDWPGNVRELENLIERLVILKGGGVIKPSDLPERFLSKEGLLGGMGGGWGVEIPEGGLDLTAKVEEFERDLVLKALKHTGWVRSRAAQLLSIKRTTLVEKMKRMGLYSPAKGSM